LIVFASVAAVSGFRGLRPRALLLAGAVSLASAVLLFPQIPRSLDGWPDYGIRWQHRPRGFRTLVHGSAGFNVPARSGLVPLEVRARSANTGDTRVEVFLGRRWVRSEGLTPGEALHLSLPWPKGTLAYVELRATSMETGAPREVLVIRAPPRRISRNSAP
jgi:hypothetical protein